MSHVRPRADIASQYQSYIKRKGVFLAVLFVLAIAIFLWSVSVGPVPISFEQILLVLTGKSSDPQANAILWNIRLPEAVAAILAGAGLAMSGTVMQSILRNPLGSPFTLGIAHAAALGAAVSVMFFGSGTPGGGEGMLIQVTNPYITVASAFASSVAAGLVIVAVARVRGPSPEIMVLTGVALGSLCTAGTMALQYFADDAQLAAMLFWTFGDVTRAGWHEIALVAVCVLVGAGIFQARQWDYNAFDAGDETARALGVNVGRVRLAGMLVAILVTAAITSFLGVIGFVGLVCPHMVRRIIGDDHRFLLPGSALAGAVLLLASSVAARLVLSPSALPVSILTAFLGAPVFLWLILRRRSA